MNSQIEAVVKIKTSIPSNMHKDFIQTLSCARGSSVYSCPHKFIAILVNTPALTRRFITLLGDITTICSTFWGKNCRCFAIYFPATSTQQVRLTACQITGICIWKWKVSSV